MTDKKTIVLVLKSGGDFSMQDVLLISHHINKKWISEDKPQLVCLWDKASREYELEGVKIIPLNTKYPGTWSRIVLYGPEMEKYRPFLYIDLDTAVIRSLEVLFDAVKDKSQFITLEDFWQPGELATGIMWVPANSSKVTKVYKSFRGLAGRRMDGYLRKVVQADAFWQKITKGIYDFKPKTDPLLRHLPVDANVVCFHGKPRIFEATHIPWVYSYVERAFAQDVSDDYKVTVIIPYKKDRGWLQDAINSVPKGVQLLVSQGDGNWPENFNKVLDQATGKYIRWLHEDDMLTENCIEDSVRTLEETGADFIHGDAYYLIQNKEGKLVRWKSPNPNPNLQTLLKKNTIHSATLMYRKDVFDKVGRMDETLNVMEEYEFNLRCLKAGLKLAYCPTELAYYRMHDTQKVRIVPASEKNEERKIVKAQYYG